MGQIPLAAADVFQFDPYNPHSLRVNLTLAIESWPKLTSFQILRPYLSKLHTKKKKNSPTQPQLITCKIDYSKHQNIKSHNYLNKVKIWM